MLRNLREFYYPTKVAEALQILERFDSRAAVIAGGTRMGRLDDAKIEAAVDITRLGLSYIKEGKVALRIGATTSIQTMARNPKLNRFAAGVLAQAARTVPSRLMRNGMTLGGSIVFQTPASELQPALMALDAEIVIQGKTEKIIPIHDFVGQPKYRQLGRHEIITEIRIPKEMSGWRGSYQVFQRTLSDPPMVIACVTMEAKADAKCGQSRLVLGGITRRSTRYEAAEKKLLGKKVGPTHFESVSKVVQKDLEAVSDWRASREYRLNMAQVVMRRTLAAAWSEEKGGRR